jgi:ubiquinone/menaquinone biosynthesis C-methylase UbiE
VSVDMLKEASQTAEDAHLSVSWIRGEANRLPFPSHSFDRLSARHMLYHVPDISGALKEFRRVVGAKGAVLAACNSVHNLPRIMALRDDLLEAFGLSRYRSSSLDFNNENARDYLEPVFESVEERILQNALVFTSIDPILGYMGTMFPSWPETEDAALRREMQIWLRAEAVWRMDAQGGVWRDPKSTGLYLCRP